MDPARRAAAPAAGAGAGVARPDETSSSTKTYRQRQIRQQEHQNGSSQSDWQQYLEHSSAAQTVTEQYNLLSRIGTITDLLDANRQQHRPLSESMAQDVAAAAPAAEPASRPFKGLYNPPGGIGTPQIHQSSLYSATAKPARNNIMIMTQQQQQQQQLQLRQQEQDQQLSESQSWSKSHQLPQIKSRSKIRSLYPMHPFGLSVPAHREPQHRRQQQQQYHDWASMPPQIQKINAETLARNRDLSFGSVSARMTGQDGRADSIPRQLKPHLPRRTSSGSSSPRKKRKGGVVGAEKLAAAAKKSEGVSSSLPPPPPHHQQQQDHVVVPMTSTLGPDVKFLAKKRRPYDAESFPEKLYRMLYEADKSGNAHIFSFNSEGMAILIHKPDQFVNEIIPKYFRHKNLESFRRQFSMYGFQRIKEGPDKGAYHHELFRRGKPELLPMIRRVTEIDVVLPPGADVNVSAGQQQQQQQQG